MFRFSKLLAILLAMIVLVTSAYAFTTTKTANHTDYNVSNIVYTFDNVNPSNLTQIAFDLDAPAATVQVSLTATDILQSCTNPSATHWTCSLTGVTITNASSLRIVASQ